ncbi:hypothetical protein L0N08_10710 [Enterocloster aldenensis]|uniref:Uncharacterized protein n=1 Tax=Enterocloster aldenensis TaxID=358742 RepID=A0AAW5C138_9FIRM|nr:hypothetical protein [Enterocloster aldenensis]
MIKKFGDYMYYLLSTPYKQVRKGDNQWYIYFSVIGQLFDANKRMFQRVREESMVRTASPLMLPEHGMDRLLTRYDGESWGNFRTRLAMYADTCLLGGTETGTLLAVKSLGFPDVEMIPCYKLDGNRDRWAEFYVIISMDADDTVSISHEMLRKEVRKVKKVSAKDNYQFRFGLECKNDETFLLDSIVYHLEASWLQGHTLNGAWKLNGKMLLNGIRNNNPLCVSHLIEMENEVWAEGHIETKHHWWTLNGAYKLDGNRRLDAKITEEAI